MIQWKHGAKYSRQDNSTTFRVWAPLAEKVKLHLQDQKSESQAIAMERSAYGYWHTTVNNCGPGTRYQISVDDGEPRPDPASRHQPDGVHAASAVVDSHYEWKTSNWTGRCLDEYVIYELHVGTFTRGGTFTSAIEELPRLKKLGITAIEIMPIAQFPGERNWGYDGVFLYAAAEAYGGLAAFQEFVDAAHAHGMAVVLDVVYNHLGPEGNYLSQFGPYFNDNYHTPWGAGVNFDDAHSDGVRDFFIGNAVFWMSECNVDALRLDAVHAIIDNSAYPFLRELSEAVHELGRSKHRKLYVIGENDLNNPLFVTPTALGGIGADSQWSDDFHHALHAAITGERHGYFEDFGSLTHLAKAFSDGFVYDGIYSPHRKRKQGADARALHGSRFVVCSQNHDQVGNRPDGTRMSMLVEFPQLKLSAVALLVSPYIPLIFMGEEVASQNPFLYFVSHSDEDLITNVREGRAREFRAFFSQGTPADPQSEETFQRSTLDYEMSPEGGAINHLYTEMLRLRSTLSVLRSLNRHTTQAWANDHRQTLVVRRQEGCSSLLTIFNFKSEEQSITTHAEKGTWHLLLHTESADYLGRHNAPETVTSNGELTVTLPAYSCVLLHFSHKDPDENLHGNSL